MARVASDEEEFDGGVILAVCDGYLIGLISMSCGAPCAPYTDF